MAPDCGVGGTSTGTITHLVINVENDELYFTIDRVIYRQKLYQTASTLYTAANQVTGKSIYKLYFYLPLRQCDNHKTMSEFRLGVIYTRDIYKLPDNSCGH